MRSQRDFFISQLCKGMMKRNPWPMILFMFSSSILLGSFITGMTPLLSDAAHYTVSGTRFGAAWYMASWMGIIEVVMSYRMMKTWNSYHTWWLVIMLFNALCALAFLQSQTFINGDNWATRMIEHHSTAVTTSRKLCQHCDRKETLCELSCQIVDVQLQEINVLQTNANYRLITLTSSMLAIALALPTAIISFRSI